MSEPSRYEQLCAIVKELAVELDTKLTFGYIGNLQFGNDYRSWSVWFHDFPRGLGEFHPTNLPSAALGCTESMYSMSDSLFREYVAARYKRLVDLSESL